MGVTELTDIEDHFLHVVAVGSNLKFTNLQNSFMKKVNPGNVGINSKVLPGYPGGNS